jgi:hypothetical protein
LGTNLDGITYFSRQIPFVNTMKLSSGWDPSDSRPLDLDGNGNVRSLAPGQSAHALTLRDNNGHYPAGRYLLRYKGEGTISVQFDGTVISQKPGEMVVQVNPSATGDGIWVQLDATNSANYLRDVELIMPGGICQGDPFTHVSSVAACGSRAFLAFADHPEILFYPVFADRLRGYSVLRFMDWMGTNNSPVKSWSDRTPFSYATWSTANGAPVDVMIALANLVGAHPWFNMPHQSDNAYAERFAQVVKAQLDPALRVYVEYSNEVWNWAFPQTAYADSQGKSQNPPIDGIEYYALRSRTVGAIFKAALSEARVVSVLGAQAANPWTATHGLDYLKTRFNNSTVGIDAMAIAPYFYVMANPAEASKYSSMSLDAFFSYVRLSVLPEALGNMARYRTAANQYKVSLISYEGGQHMIGVNGGENDAGLNTLFDAFNRDPRIKQLYLDYLAGWKNAGGELFMHYTDVGPYTKWGRWGALEYIDQPRSTSPKFDAIQSFIERNPVWWTQ